MTDMTIKAYEKGITKIFGVVQRYYLESEETSLHIEGYETEPEALKALKQELDKLREEILDNDNVVQYEEFDESAMTASIGDDKQNEYQLEIMVIPVFKTA